MVDVNKNFIEQKANCIVLWLRVKTLESDMVQSLVLPLSTCVTLSRLFFISKPQLPWL